MKVTINHKEIPLDNTEVKISRRIAAKFLKRVQDRGKEERMPTFYYTFLIVLQAMTQELLSDIDPENLQRFMDALVEPGQHGSGEENQ